jgi:hypothetical protein
MNAHGLSVPANLEVAGGDLRVSGDRGGQEDVSLHGLVSFGLLRAVRHLQSDERRKGNSASIASATSSATENPVDLQRFGLPDPAAKLTSLSMGHT